MGLNALSNRILIRGMALALFILITSILVGRAWCGWICPMGSLIDFFSWRQSKKRQVAPDQRWRKIKFLLLMVMIAAAILGNLTLLIFDPITIFVRSFSAAILPGLDQLLWIIETTLYRIPFFRSPIAALDNLVRPSIFPIQPQEFQAAGWLFLFFASILALNLIVERFWCRYICPLGGLLGLVGKFSVFKREVKSSCTKCNRCANVCPTGTIDQNRDFRSDPAECTWCMDCLAVCPNKSNVFEFKATPATWEKYDPERREVLASLAIGITSAAVLQVDPSSPLSSNFHLRPPGVSQEKFLSQCVRCGECIRVCPTTALQPSIIESGLKGFWSPVLIPRMGYCDYSCNACGQICPVEAIPALPLSEKRLQKVGSAYIDEDRCLAWSDGTPCIVCEEMCPLPQKAITLHESKGRQSSAENQGVLLPEVNRELCIGCGICEFKCPVIGEAAIRVHLPQL